MSIYLDDIGHIFEINSATTPLLSNEELQSLLLLFNETKDFEIFKSVTSQLFTIAKCKFFSMIIKKFYNTKTIHSIQ